MGESGIMTVRYLGLGVSTNFMQNKSLVHHVSEITGDTRHGEGVGRAQARKTENHMPNQGISNFPPLAGGRDFSMRKCCD